MNKQFLTGIVIALLSAQLGVWLGYHYCYREFAHLSLLTKSQELTQARMSIITSELLNQKEYQAVGEDLASRIENGHKITQEFYNGAFEYSSWPFIVNEWNKDDLKEQVESFEREYESYNKWVVRDCVPLCFTGPHPKR